MDLLAVIGVLAFAIGLLLSIALHEIGHLIPAKLFGIKVTQYMVGFGRTVWSRRRGETEYGFKAIPLGGYVRMIGMFPPEPGADPRRLRSASTGPFQALIEDARRAAKVEIEPGDEDRVFYRQAWWKKLIVMLGGPMTNVVIALVLAAGLLMTFGNPQKPVLTPVASSVSACVIPASEQRAECLPTDPVAPAAKAGIEPGDRLVSIAGTPIETWDEAREIIRDLPEGDVEVVVDRNGDLLSLTAPIMVSERPTLDSTTEDIEYEDVGFLGISPTIDHYERENLAGVAGWMGEFTATMAKAVVSIPQRMVGVWDAAFGGGERDVNGPIGIVGAGRIGGEIASDDDLAVGQRIASFVMLLASFNMAIALFNFIPLLPLDGGHIAGALWEAVKRAWAKLTHGPTPKPVDVAKALPLAYGVAVLLISMAVLLLYADIVNPVRLSG
ncbi:MAG TPA: site-2 protease family protein [Jiangellaceae bacterium]|nr:site-2 protease family protein [Jiangellaceae bacterium]